MKKATKGIPARTWFYSQSFNSRAHLDEPDPRHTCVFCGRAIAEDERVETKAGGAHEDCAEDHYPLDPGDSVWPK
jgi:hypothetical protein